MKRKGWSPNPGQETRSSNKLLGWLYSNCSNLAVEFLEKEKGKLRLHINQTISSPLFNEPMKVLTITPGGNEVYVLGLVGTKSQTFRQVNLTEHQIEELDIIDSSYTYAGNANLQFISYQ